MPTTRNFKTAYVDCALWSSTDNADESGGEPLDKNYDVRDIDDASLSVMGEDCDDFVAFCEREGIDLSVGDDEQNGHDFWLTRNHHGAGFWDHGYANGDALTKAAHSFGSVDLYVGDDRKIHHA